MALHIEPFIADDNDHLEDRMLGEFDSFLSRRGACCERRVRGRALLLEALEQIGDAEEGWGRLSLVGCAPTLSSEASVGYELVLWLAATARLTVRTCRRLLRQLEPARTAPPRVATDDGAPTTRLAA